jgi:hypothetical protein
MGWPDTECKDMAIVLMAPNMPNQLQWDMLKPVMVKLTDNHTRPITLSHMLKLVQMLLCLKQQPMVNSHITNNNNTPTNINELRLSLNREFIH